MGLKKFNIILTGLIMLASCGRPGTGSKLKDSRPPIFPDYYGVTIPINIAPLNFRVDDDADRIHVIFEGRNSGFAVNGSKKVIIPIKKWRKLLLGNSDDSVAVTVFARTGKTWEKYLPFRIHVKKEPVDPWLAYRLIAPGYESWSAMGIYQRDLTSFTEKTIIDNRLLPGACMNCHSFRLNSPDNMVFHIRGNIPGTMLVQDGEIQRLATKTKETISNCVYPFWHPSGNYIAFSVNSTSQVFHSTSEKRIEVFDSRSDLVVYDIRNNKLLTTGLISSEESFETFPVFSPDGNSLFFCSSKKGQMPDDFEKIRYSLCRISFDPSTGSFGNEIDTLISSYRTGGSVAFPRISPDGKFLVFTLSDYGTFPIWHREADLYLIDPEGGEFHNITRINSNESDSYHSWSSNSRWLVFSSRRTDGLYTRPFISYCDSDGSFSKPFMLPQKDPDYYQESLRSFNVPEFITGKVPTDGRSMLKSIGSPAKNVNFELQK